MTTPLESALSGDYGESLRLFAHQCRSGEAGDVNEQRMRLRLLFDDGIHAHAFNQHCQQGDRVPTDQHVLACMAFADQIQGLAAAENFHWASILGMAYEVKNFFN